jgi:hypothetical protein
MKSETVLARPPWFGLRRAVGAGGWLRAVPAGVHFATALVLLLSGCTSQRGLRWSDLATLQVEARFGDLKTAAGPSSVRLVKAEAFELTGAERVPVLRDSASATLPPGQSHFRLELHVPPADLYLVRLKMEGTTGTPDNPSDDGLLYFGEANVENLRAGTARPVSMMMVITVPIVRLETTQRGWHVMWSPLPGAQSYILREGLPPPRGVQETPTMVTDTLVAFPPALQDAQKLGAYFQVAARFPAGITGAFSPKVTGDRLEPNRGASD